MNQSQPSFLYRIVSFAVLLAILTSQVAIAAPAQHIVVGEANHQTKTSIINNILFRTRVTLRTPLDLQYLQELDVVVLESGENWAQVLVTANQLETLARLRFVPTATEELENLVATNIETYPQLQTQLQPLFQQAAEAEAERRTEGSISDETEITLRESLTAIPVETRTILLMLGADDSDGDGLTGTEETWWCTDPNNPNSDGDANGYSDGEEVTALLDFTLPRNVRWGYGPPFGPPSAWPDWNGGDGNPNTPACNDGDYDTIPDFAEVFVVGSQVPEETTDGDKFDDGQELFGTTYCPGAPTSCGHGNYPRIEYWNYIQASMPSWVEPPGDNLFVAAFPVPEVYVVPGSWTVERVTTITTEEGQMTQTTNNYATSMTRGQSTSIANTVTWNEWEEVSEAVETPISALNHNAVRTSNIFRRNYASMKVQTGTGAATLGLIAGVGCAIITAGGCAIGLAVGAMVAGAGVSWALSGIDDLVDLKADELQMENPSTRYEKAPSCPCENSSSTSSNQNYEYQGVATSLDGVHYAINQQSELLARSLYDISYAISQPRYTETKTNGRSWGGAQTTTHEVYEEHTITQGEAFTTGENWSTAWAVDSSHAADLTFDYTVQNDGTEYAREITGLIFNVYLGDDSTPIISYPAWQQFPNGKLENVFPGDNSTFASDPIPLTLEQMRRIDLGDRLTIVVEDFSYGADELFYQDAVNGGVTVFVEDGVEDGDELVDMYVIPTWGVESVQDVLTRYFPADVDDDGNLNSLWTPEFNGINPPTWYEHFLSEIAWWNIYLTQTDTGNTPLHQLSAQQGSALLFRFNRDSDRDGYQDRVEDQYGTDKNDPASHPNPEIMAGYVTTLNGNEATVLLKLANTGTFDAYGIDAVMYAPDDTVTIGNNTVGGNGRVRPGTQIAVGSLILPPDLSNWTTSTAQPYAIGNYSGNMDKTITFTVSTPGVVGQSSTALAWTDNITSGTLDLGSSYHAPLPVDVIDGVQVGFDTGTLGNGESFAVTALTPRDTFTYTINNTPYTPPVIVVSYSDPQGSHRFVTPVELGSLADDVTAYSGQMLPDVQVSIVTSNTVDPVNLNTTHFIINSPHPEPIEDAHLYLNFVSDGTLVAEMPYTMTLQPGPTVIPIGWLTSSFTQTYDAEADNILIAFWTDAQKNIIDSAARPLPSFQQDPNAEANVVPTAWDFGTLTQGAIAKTHIAVANTGLTNLFDNITVNGNGLTISATTSSNIFPTTFHEFELVLDTAELTPGSYSGTVTVQTSDVNAPQTIINVSGVIAPLSGNTLASAISQYRPWDQTVYISGTYNLNDTLTFNHTLSDPPEKMHPLYVYTHYDDTFLGIGEFGVDTTGQATSAAIFGDGSDGDLYVAAGQTAYTDDVRTQLMNTASTGEDALCVASTAGFQVGDEILVIQSQGTEAGNYEFGTITNISTCWLTLKDSLANTYVTPNSAAQVLRVPHYGDVTIDGTLTAHAWDGITGGIVAFRASGSVIIESGGIISVSGKGFRGGIGQGVNLGGQNGESIDGFVGRGGTSGGGTGSYGGGSGASNSATSPRGQRAGGAGSGGYDYANGGQGDEGTGGGGGGGHATAGGGGGGGGDSYSWGGNGGLAGGTGGGNGGNQSNPGGDGGQSPSEFTGTGGASWNGPDSGTGGGGGGGAVGNNLVSNILFGSGGGASGAYQGRNTGHHIGRNGGSGGGIIFISPRTIEIIGQIIANGQNGVNANGRAGGGGGGAGGSIVLQSYNLNLLPNLIQAFEGTGGIKSGASGGGGQGGVGRIHAQYCNDLTGNTNPPASPEQITCYIVRQLPGNPNTELILPEAIVDYGRYHIQYGQHNNFPITGTQTYSVTLPKQTYDALSLDALFQNLGNSNFNFDLDIGADGSLEWSGSGTEQPLLITSPDPAALAVGLNNYLLTTPDTWGTNVTIPIHVTLDTSGDLFLTNLLAAAGSNSDAQTGTITFDNNTPTEGEIVTIEASVSNTESLPINNVTAAFFAGDPDIDGVYLGADYIPEIQPGSMATAALSWDTEGFGGDVNIYIVLDLAGQIDETDENNNTASQFIHIKSRADLQTMNVIPSQTYPRNGIPVTVTAVISNVGETDSGLFAVTFYDDSDPFITDTVTIPGGSSAVVNVTWTPTRMGNHALAVTADSNSQVTESDETNNQAIQTVFVGLYDQFYADSGDAPADPAYDAIIGYGWISGTMTGTWGTLPEESYRWNPSGPIRYQFDYLVPDADYHVDVTLLDGNGGIHGTETLWIDGFAHGSKNLSDGQVHWISARPDAVLYTDHSLTVDVTTDDFGGAIVSEIAVREIDYRYIDAGPNTTLDQPYTPSLGYGYLNGFGSNTWGSTPIETFRWVLTDTVLYRFDDLDPARNYQINVTLYQEDTVNRQQTVLFDGIASGVNLVPTSVPTTTVVAVPKTAYELDGQVVVGIQRTNGNIPIINAIALEERTVPWENDTDWVGPAITNVTYPVSVTSIQTATVTADISDVGRGNNGVATAWLVYGYAPPYNSFTAVGTAPPGGNGDGTWTFTIPPQGGNQEGQTLRFTLLATDGDDTPATTTDDNNGAYYPLMISDDDIVGPIIGLPTYPGTVASNQPFTITAAISDLLAGNHGVITATLFYGYLPPHDQNIEPGIGPGGNGDGVWTFSLPAQGSSQEGQTLTFWLTAADGDNSPTMNTDPGPYQVFITSPDTTPPTSSASSPPYANTSPIDITWTAFDSESGIDFVSLWVRYDGGTWTDTGQTQSGTSGTFAYTPAGGEGTYDFATVAVDNLGNVEGSPTGSGDTTTLYDLTPPASLATSPAVVNTPAVTVSWTAVDNFSGVVTTTLWVRFDNGVWIPSGLPAQSGTSGDFIYPFNQGDGIYDFFTIATDNAGNQENSPTTPDATTIYDTAAPQSTANSPTYANTTPISITWTASDGGSGIDFVTLWVRYDGGTWADTGQTQSGAGGIFLYQLNQGDGLYDFYTISIDNAGNQEAPPATPDTTTIYDTTAPQSTANSPSYANTSPISITWTASDGGSGIDFVTLWVRYDGGTWADTGQTQSGTGGTFIYAPTNGEGVYDLATVAEDHTGNEEENPTGTGDTTTIYDVTPPTSSANSPVEVNTITVTVDWTAADNLSGVTTTTLWVRFNSGVWTPSELPSQSGTNGTFVYTFAQGGGLYDFYTIATDNAGNQEMAPTAPDTTTIYDATAPQSTASSPTYANTSPISIDWTAIDTFNRQGVLNISEVALWVKIGTNNWLATGLTQTGNSGTFTYPAMSDETYCFATVATDTAGNQEPPPVGSGDSCTHFDTTSPTSEAISPTYANTALDVDWVASDSFAGLDTVALWVKIGDSSWTATGLVQSGIISGTFDYSPAAGQGVYCFATVATDTAGNQETTPIESGDTCTVFDTTVPTSEASTPTETGESDVQVAWTAVDDLSGIARVTLWLRIDGGEWESTDFITTTQSSGVFTYTFGASGTYEFATQAIDQAGNEEGIPIIADTTVVYFESIYLFLPIIRR